MSLSGLYVGPRRLITFSSEVLWLAISTALLVVLNGSSAQHHSIALLAYQSTAIVAIYISIFYLMDLYDLDLVTPRRALLINLAQSIGLVCITLGGLEAGTRILRLDPRLALAHLLLTALFVVSGRALIDHVGISGHPREILGIVADDKVRKQLDRDNERRPDLHFWLRWIGVSMAQAQDALDSVQEYTLRRQRIVIDPELLNDRTAVRFVELCKQRGMDLEDLLRFAERSFGKVVLGPQIVRDLAVSPIMSRSRISRSARRMRDIVIASLALLVTSPATILIALAVKLESSGPVFFTQERIGENGRPFTMIKFRTMYQDGKPDGERSWTTHEADPRVTRLGNLLRTLHLDELPQLVNVIKGEMSVVGPRPFHTSQVAELQSKLPYLGLRHLVLPGITGWAQIRCDYAASVESCEEVLSRDLFYVKHVSMLFDVLIMLDTIRVCIWRRGSR